MTKEEKQKEDKRELNTRDIEIYDVLPSIRKENQKGTKKPLQKLDRSESCM